MNFDFGCCPFYMLRFAQVLISVFCFIFWKLCLFFHWIQNIVSMRSALPLLKLIFLYIPTLYVNQSTNFRLKRVYFHRIFSFSCHWYGNVLDIIKISKFFETKSSFWGPKLRFPLHIFGASKCMCVSFVNTTTRSNLHQSKYFFASRSHFTSQGKCIVKPLIVEIAILLERSWWVDIELLDIWEIRKTEISFFSCFFTFHDLLSVVGQIISKKYFFRFPHEPKNYFEELKTSFYTVHERNKRKKMTKDFTKFWQYDVKIHTNWSLVVIHYRHGKVQFIK